MGKNILTKELLLRSVWKWNEARNEYPDLKPDLRKADLYKANLRHANLIMANLNDADLSEADLSKANLMDASLMDANLTMADLIQAELIRAKLRNADLTEANLSDASLLDADLNGVFLLGANLSNADLSGACLYDADIKMTDLDGANLSWADIGFTTFGDVDLSKAIGLDTIRHASPSIIGIETIYKSKGKIPEVFLRGCGVPDSFITYARSLTVNPIDFYSCFISYSTKDDDFARRIHNDLQAAGVRCWFAPHDIQGGKKVLHQIEEAIRLYDKLLLILSPDSMNSNWVEQEIINAIKKEKQQQKQMLFPISIAPFEEIKKWKRFDSDSGRDLAREIREYHIPDFSLWGSDQVAYKTSFERLLKDLKQ